jgi:two-component system sporulation sensor kinase C
MYRGHCLDGEKNGEDYFFVSSHDIMENFGGASESHRDENSISQQFEEIIAVILHEVRNPLQTAKTFIQAMEKISPQNEEIAAYYPAVLEELDRADILLGTFLNFSRKTVNEFTRADLSPLCQETVSLLKSRAILKNIVIEEIYPEEEIPILADAGRIRQIILNLLLNAFDACSEGGRIVVDVGSAKNKGIIQIKDDGCGMSRENLNNIFKLFYTTKTHGTGIGLPLVLKLLASHQGFLEVRSKKGRGSVFSVILPLIGGEEPGGRDY